MSHLSDKYGIPEETVKLMVKDGVISCSMPMYHEIVYHYKKSQSLQKTADEFNISRTRVWEIVHQFNC